MKCRLIAAGTRMPAWVDAGFADYQKRLVKPLSLELHEIAVAVRRGSEPPARAVARESQAMLAALGKDDFVVALDVQGKAMSTEQFADWLRLRMQQGKNMSFLIGGPDGLHPELRSRADFAWSLSALTFPHALARVMVAEQIYRAASIIAHHPYHRA
jgi:23S rRNA (pseudouridine1915-N3)-methyltransferase